jgi:2-oxoglutarate ferredoxin oxidoreductase subunit alpha
MDSITSPATPAGSKPEAHVPRSLTDVVVRLAGNSQDGIQAVGGFLARLAGRSAQEVMTYMTIPSTISGGPSIFQVRMGTGDILSSGDRADVLVAFYQHSYDDHRAALRPGGVLLYDSDQVKPNPDDHEVNAIGVPFTAATVEAVGGSAKEKGKNIYVLGLLARMFDLNVPKLTQLIKERFAGKSEDVARNALVAFDSGYAYPGENLRKHLYRLEQPEPRPDARPQITTDGNAAIAYGLIAAGVRYGAAYPITPATSIMEILRAELPKYGGLFVQCEDEIAAIATALGFSYGGNLAITNTSGPGLSLKAEALGWAVMAEIPLIVVNVQRGGPSTGLPTSIEQSDLLQAIYGSHGDAPRVVLAPHTVEDCFYVALEAARIAREFSTPVIILSDQALSTRIEAFDEPDLTKLMVEAKPDLRPRDASFKPYPFDGPTRHAPPGTVMGSGKYPTVSGLEHDELGHPSANPVVHAKMTAKRRDKIKAVAATFTTPEVFGDQSGDLLLIGWGCTYGPIHEAVGRLQGSGVKVGHLHLRHIHPLDPGLDQIFARYQHIRVIEINDQGLYGYGQLATLLRSVYCNPAIASITKTEGLTYRVSEIVERVAEQLGLTSIKSGARKHSILAAPDRN